MFAAKERTIFLQLTQINSSFVTMTKKKNGAVHGQKKALKGRVI